MKQGFISPGIIFDKIGNYSLQECPPEALSFYFANYQLIHQPSSRIIYKEGEADEYVYFVLVGDVKICRKNNRRNVLIRIATEGDILGISPVAEPVRYSHSAITRGPALLCKVRQHDFRCFQEDYPGFRWRLAKDLAYEIERLEGIMS